MLARHQEGSAAARAAGVWGRECCDRCALPLDLCKKEACVRCAKLDCKIMRIGPFFGWCEACAEQHPEVEGFYVGGDGKKERDRQRQREKQGKKQREGRLEGQQGQRQRESQSRRRGRQRAGATPKGASPVNAGTLLQGGQGGRPETGGAGNGVGDTPGGRGAKRPRGTG